MKSVVDALSAARAGASATATAAATAAASSSTKADSADGKGDSGWELIRKLVKLLRTKGNQYGYAVGVRYQEWCRWHGKRDALKGLTRVVGVRPDAWARNAKPILLARQHGLDAFFDWLAVQKDQDNGEKKANRLESSVRNACRDERTVNELWAIAAFSDGLFQPMMMAINEDASKNMLQMCAVAFNLRYQVREWSQGRSLDCLQFGLLPSAAPPLEVVICAAATYLDPHTLVELACVSRHTLWNVQKRRHTNTKELSHLAGRVLPVLEHFIEEYLPNGALYKPSAAAAATAAVAPTNNDAVERLFGVYDYFNSKVAVNMTEPNKEGRIVSRVNHTVEWWMDQSADIQTRALNAARGYAVKTKGVWAERRQRDAQLRRTRADLLQAINQRKHTNRAKRQQRFDELKLWTSKDELTRALQSIRGKTARFHALRSQLMAYKKCRGVKHVRLSAGGRQLEEEELRTQLLTVMENHGRSSASTTALAVSSSSASALRSAPTPKRRHTAKAATPLPTTTATPPATSKTVSRNEKPPDVMVLQCCGSVDTGADRCVQCDSCAAWNHCECERVSWEAANSMEWYLCRVCMGEMPGVS